MTHRIDLAVAKKPVREFIRDLGKFRHPIELVDGSAVVAKLIPPAELTDSEKQLIVDKGWQVVEKARANTAELSPSAIQKEVDRAVQKIRGHNDQRRG